MLNGKEQITANWYAPTEVTSNAYVHNSKTENRYYSTKSWVFLFSVIILF